MRISVNLATRPFVELRPLYALLRIGAIALAILAVVLGIVLHSLTAKERAGEAQMNVLKGKTQQFQQERQRNEARMRQPQNMAVLERSQFLNAVFATEELQLDRGDDGPRACSSRGGAGDEHRSFHQ